MGVCVVSALTDRELARVGPIGHAPAPSWPQIRIPQYQDPAQPRSIDQILADYDRVFTQTFKDERLGTGAIREQICRNQIGVALGPGWQVRATDGCAVIGIPGAGRPAARSLLADRAWKHEAIDLPRASWRDYAPVRAAVRPSRDHVRPIRWAITADRLIWTGHSPAMGRGWPEDDNEARGWAPVTGHAIRIPESAAVPIDDRYVWPLRGADWRVIVGGETDPWIFVHETGAICAAVMPRRR